MTPEEFAVCYVPVPLRQRHMAAGDVFVIRKGEAEQLWTVRAARPGWMDAARLDAFHARDVDPDAVFQVLTPVPMAQAAALTRGELGAQLIARRNDAEVAA